MARPYNPHLGGLEKGGGRDKQGDGVLPIVKVLSFTLAKGASNLPSFKFLLILSNISQDPSNAICGGVV